MMTYKQTLSYLYASTPAFHLIGSKAYKPGLDHTIRLMEHLGNPHTKWPSVHIAGTNGKGSTSHLIAAVLQSANLKVGLYTSPHLVDFRERIRINGQMIDQQSVVRFVDENKVFLDSLQPSFFEITMAMAFWYFAQQEVDIAVIEVGLGGRLDSTNIITPLVSVITNIGMDHTEFLGNTLEQIASEKAGIIKPNIPCIIGETDPITAPIFIEKARQCNLLGEGLETTHCRVYFADQCEYLRRCRMRDIKECQLHGIYQEHNMQTAYVALHVINQQFSIHHSPFSILNYQQGFSQVCTMTGLRGRWETLSKAPLTICDTGHNSHGIQYVCQQLRQLAMHHAPCTMRIIFGMVADKDVERVMALLPTQALYYFTQARTQRAVAADDMLALSQPYHLQGNAYSSVEKAIRAAQKDATDQDIIFIGGSNYVVGEALPLFH